MIVRSQPGDPYFSSVVLLAHFHGTNGSQTFTNSCPRGTDLITSGTDALSTSTFVFGPTSLRRGAGTNTTNDSIHQGAGGTSVDYRLGSGDWTIEFRYRVDAIGLRGVFDMRDDNASRAAPSLYLNVGGTLNYYVSNTTQMSSGNVISAATWYAIALCRVGATTRMFVDGAVVASFADSINYNYVNTRFYIPDNPSQPNWGINANFEEFRITSGVGRYSGTYTPAGQPFPNH